MRCLTNTDLTTAEEKRGGLLTERGVQKGYEYQTLYVDLSYWTSAQPANPDPLCVCVCTRLTVCVCVCVHVTTSGHGTEEAE